MVADHLMLGYLNAADAAALDAELMADFSLEQFMELAGLAVAEAVYQVVPPQSGKQRPRILLVCGPGNNGGDGLVAARHLVHFGYDCFVVYPKQSTKRHFINLVQQCKAVGIPLLEEWPTAHEDGGDWDAIVDAVHGHSFKEETPRESFKTVLQCMQDAQTSENIPVISVDVPSGWNVDEGDVAETGFLPEVLVSLTAPKESARKFQGRHFVGGRFLPPKLADKYNIRMPLYPSVSQVVEVTHIPQKAEAKSSSVGWEAEYAAYLAAQHSEENVADSSPTLVSGAKRGGESWEAEYAAYCAEKEARLAKEDSQCIQKLKESQ